MILQRRFISDTQFHSSYMYLLDHIDLRPDRDAWWWSWSLERRNVPWLDAVRSLGAQALDWVAPSSSRLPRLPPCNHPWAMSGLKASHYVVRFCRFCMINEKVFTISYVSSDSLYPINIFRDSCNSFDLLAQTSSCQSAGMVSSP